MIDWSPPVLSGDSELLMCLPSILRIGKACLVDAAELFPFLGLCIPCALGLAHIAAGLRAIESFADGMY